MSGLFPARGVFLGERPLSQRQLKTIVARLSAAIDNAGSRVHPARREWAQRELAIVLAELQGDQGVRPSARVAAASRWRTDFFVSDAQAERITPNGLGSLDAVSHPFAENRHGWPIIDGKGTSIALTHLLGIGRFALAVEPRYSLVVPRGGERHDDLVLHRVYARGVLGNVALRVGSDEMQWGQSPVGALFISGHARPFPALALGMDTAITLPWLFRLAGPIRGTVFLADLGASQTPPHAKLAGWQVSVAPWSRFELGVAVLAHEGGSGGPKATFLERVVDLFPIIDALAPQHADLQISNKLAGGNLRLRIPELSGLDVYYELQIDDFDLRRFRSSFVEDAGHLVGSRLPLILPGGQLALRAEWHRTSLRLYEHAQFRSGVTYRGQLIGDPIGPNAKALYVQAEWRSAPLHGVAIAFADERRDPSLYTAISDDARDRGFRFVRLTDDPRHHRNRVTATFERVVDVGSLRFTLGHNRAWRRGQPARGEWLGRLSFGSRRLAVF